MKVICPKCKGDHFILETAENGVVIIICDCGFKCGPGKDYDGELNGTDTRSNGS